VILAVGRFEPVKDFATLIRAFAVYRENHSARLMILGEGRLRPELEQLVQELGLGRDVCLPGFFSNPYAMMKRAAAVVISSRLESLSVVLIEAMALGVPVISTDCDFGPREILAGGKYGRLTPVGDVASLAEALKQVVGGATPTVPPEALRSFELSAAVDEYLNVLLGQG
jgi:glycosyltransferase involved in cell wall biosynthesis